jgi:hypothetical protein
MASERHRLHRPAPHSGVSPQLTSLGVAGRGEVLPEQGADFVVIDMSGWKVRTVDVLKDVGLDPLNVRLDLVADAPEADVMLDLFQNEKALRLVESIVKVGYLTHEIPIVVKRGQRLVVVEGNRRFAALKAIQNPYLVPEFQSRISALTKEFGGREGLLRVDVKVAPNQDDANQLVATLHAGSPRLAWAPARQAAFFQAQIEGGKTYQQLRANYPTIDIDKYVLRSEMLRRVRAVKYSTPEVTDFANGRSLSASTLARLYESKDFIELAGLKLGPAGQLVMSLSKRVFDEMAKVIVQGMYDGNVDTRSIGTTKSPRFQSLMAELREIAAPSQKADKSASASSSESEETGAREPGASKPAGRSSTAATGSGSGTAATSQRPGTGKKAYLDVADLASPAGFPPSVDRILREFSTLNVDTYPNAAFDLLRTLLEKTTKAFAESKNEDIKKSGNNQKGYVYLSDCLKWLEQWFGKNGPKSLVQVAKKMQSLNARDFAGSSDLLNAINHNHKIVAHGEDVRTSYDTMHGLLVEMLK